MNYDYLIFIGRFQPFHNGHKHIIEEALKLSKNLIILCGSSNKCGTLKNPFTFLERKKMILDSFTDEVKSKLYVKPLNDFSDDNKWIEAIHSIIKNISNSTKIALVGHTKDKSSYYLKLFKSIKYIEIPKIYDIDATHIRKIIFNKNTLDEVKKQIENLVPNGTLNFIIRFLSKTANSN